MKDSILGAAVLGLGVGAQHALAFQADPRTRLLQVCDHDPVRARQIADQLGTSVAADFDAIINNPDVRIVSIATYDADHADQVLMALEAGKHVFVEKPLCQNLHQLRAIKKSWEAHGGDIKLSSNLILRTAPLYGWLRVKIKDGGLGRLFAFDGEYLYGRLHKITGGWRSKTENYSVMEGGGIHMIDLMLWLTCERPRQVFAMGNRISTEGSDYRYMDYVTASLQGGSGMVSRITANFGCVHRHQHILRIFGTNATFLYDDSGARLHESRDPNASASAVTLSPLPETKGDLIPAFITSIVNNEDTRAETQIVFDGLSVSVACDRALETQRMEDITYV